jgi:hypothetical protein
MPDAAAFEATVHGFRTVPTRKVVQITVEAPIEQHAKLAAIAVHGAWVVVARLDPEKAEPEKRQRAWAELTPTAQAAIRCDDPEFHRFLSQRYGDWNPRLRRSTETAAVFIRERCGVKSRADITGNEQATAAWRGLDVEFLDWQRGCR